MRDRHYCRIDRNLRHPPASASSHRSNVARSAGLAGLCLLLGLAGTGCTALGDSAANAEAADGSMASATSRFVSQRLPIPGAPLVAEFLLNDQGERLLLMHDTRTLRVQPFALNRLAPGAAAGSTAANQQVRCERVWSHPRGAAFYAFKIEGNVVGFLTVQADASFSFDRYPA